VSVPLAMMWVELAVAGGQTEAFQWLRTQSMTKTKRDEAWHLLA